MIRRHFEIYGVPHIRILNALLKYGTKWFILIWLIVISCSNLTAQDNNSFRIKKAKSIIVIDGLLLDADWNEAEELGNFDQHYPFDSSKALTRTTVRVTHDQKYLYISAVCYDDLEGEYIVQSLKRDFDFSSSDAFVVVIDPFGDQTNGFAFSVNPYGVQSESLISNGGDRGVSYSWDNKWISKVIRTQGRWTVEMAIPFKTLRFKDGEDTWNINFARNDLKRPEQSTWVKIPRNHSITRLTFTGSMIWNEPPIKTGANISLIPYVIGRTDNDGTTQTSANTGLTAKIGLSSSLNLDLTINPDFSQVEVDQQIINLTRFNLFFPEKRTFFIENSDLFGQYGFRQIRPFFSRRIGLFQGQAIPIIAGARLSGKANKYWRIGVMSVQTEGTYIDDGNDDLVLYPSQNYTVTTAQRQVFGGASYISAVFVNRQQFDGFKLNKNDFNRIAGVDYNLASKDGKWKGKVFYHHSFNPTIPGNQWKYQNTNASWLLYNSPHVFAMWNHEYVGKNYIADVGFVPRLSNFNAANDTVVRLSYWRWEPIFNYLFYSSSDVILSHGPGVYGSIYQDSSLKNTEVLYQVNYKIDFRNTSLLNVKLNYNSTRLIFPSDVTGTGDSALPVGIYVYNSAEIIYSSNKRKSVSYGISGGYGGFFNGTAWFIRGDLNYRIQPWGIISVNFRRDQVALPAPYANTVLTLVGPKLEFSFSKQLFFTTFIQYNTQQDNININSRLQWRFKPMSDLFIVYTDNYQQTVFANKNRALVLKLVYWFSV